jgi:hypothetical protein
MATRVSFRRADGSRVTFKAKASKAKKRYAKVHKSIRKASAGFVKFKTRDGWVKFKARK